MLNIRIEPSILAADMGHLADECLRAQTAGSDGLHIDIMDGQFVNNLSMGLDIIRVVRGIVDIELGVHLMIMRPDWYVERCVEFGANTVYIHAESPCHVRHALELIRKAGGRAALTLNPETPADAAWPLLDAMDEILIMSVHPGFGGQSFIADVLPKISAIRERAPELDIAVDGGIAVDTAARVAAAGANVMLAGSSIYRAPDMAAEIKTMRDGVRQALDAR
jgi:ribulose-phosphate 3-epimerase